VRRAQRRFWLCVAMPAPTLVTRLCNPFVCGFPVHPPSPDADGFRNMTACSRYPSRPATRPCPQRAARGLELSPGAAERACGHTLCPKAGARKIEQYVEREINRLWLLRLGRSALSDRTGNARRQMRVRVSRRSGRGGDHSCAGWPLLSAPIIARRSGVAAVAADTMVARAGQRRAFVGAAGRPMILPGSAPKSGSNRIKGEAASGLSDRPVAVCNGLVAASPKSTNIATRVGSVLWRAAMCVGGYRRTRRAVRIPTGPYALVLSAVSPLFARRTLAIPCKSAEYAHLRTTK